jgi:chemotaxis protein CheD
MIEIFLQPGEYYVGDADCRIRTLLGSCVSITLWHPKMRIGGMTHFLLSERGSDQVLELDGRYGDEAMWILLRELMRLEVDPTKCVAKIFGGGNMFRHAVTNRTVNIGKKNGEAARAMLQGYGIPIVSESLYGDGHRQIIFDVSNGHVWSRLVKTAQHAA